MSTLPGESKAPSNPWWKWLRGWAFIALGVMLGAILIEGISYDGFWALIFAVLVISFLNTILRPILILLTLPFVFLTLGLGVLLINGLLFWLAGEIVPGFQVSSFWAGFGGGLIVTVIHIVVAVVTGEKNERGPVRVNFGRQARPRRDSRRRDEDNDDIIDV